MYELPPRGKHYDSYFNQRLLHVNCRFAKDIEYLLATQYAVKHKQVHDEISIAVCQTQGKQD